MTPDDPLPRRRLLQGAGAALALGAGLGRAADGRPDFATPPPVLPMQARADRLIDIAVCLRPFRAQGPRIEAQWLHGKTVIHNYGHGGCGWSLSWGAAQRAVQLVQAAGARRLAVVGCGAIGLTTARLAQDAGLRVRIYTSALPLETGSSAATGVWSPSSRLCLQEHATPAFQRSWEAMARTSFHRFQSMLGLAADPVQWRDGYVLSDQPFDQPMAPAPEGVGEPDYAELLGLLRDITPRSVPLTAAQHPFAVPHVRRYTQLVFNLPAYARLLLDDFLRRGGELVMRHFEHPRQWAALPERTLVNATGYGARALLGDDSLVPVRGQTARLIPQPGVDYSIVWRGHNLQAVNRRDGILVQAQARGDYGNADTTPDRAASEAAVARLASLFG